MGKDRLRIDKIYYTYVLYFILLVVVSLQTHFNRDTQMAISYVTFLFILNMFLSVMCGHGIIIQLAVLSVALLAVNKDFIVKIQKITLALALLASFVIMEAAKADLVFDGRALVLKMQDFGKNQAMADSFSSDDSQERTASSPSSSDQYSSNNYGYNNGSYNYQKSPSSSSSGYVPAYMANEQSQAEAKKYSEPVLSQQTTIIKDENGGYSPKRRVFFDDDDNDIVTRTDNAVLPKTAETVSEPISKPQSANNASTNNSVSSSPSTKTISSSEGINSSFENPNYGRMEAIRSTPTTVYNPQRTVIQTIPANTGTQQAVPTTQVPVPVANRYSNNSETQGRLESATANPENNAITQKDPLAGTSNAAQVVQNSNNGNSPVITSPKEAIIFQKPKQYEEDAVIKPYAGIRKVPQPAKKPQQNYYCDYVVKNTDNLSIIGKHFNASAAEMAVVMGLKDGQLEIDKTYRIPVLFHIVQPNEDSADIAKKYNISANEVRIINNNVNDIETGKTILLPIIDRKKVNLQGITTISDKSSVSKPVFIWPSSSISEIIPSKNKAGKNDGVIVITSRVKDVVAIGTGAVVYVGKKEQYDNMIIIKHDRDYFSVYGKLSDILVQKDDVVIAGQSIAKVSNIDNKRTGIYFSLRKDKKMLDVSDYLPNK